MKTFTSHFFSSRAIAAVLPLLSVLPLDLASGQGDYPMTYKSGINVNILGTAGTDYAVEEFYHDRTLADFKVVFLKDTTQIEMEHNANNIKAAGTAATLEEGSIVLKPDGDRHINLEVVNWQPYSGPFSFEDLNYGIFGDTATPVVGTTGNNGVTQSRSNREKHYFRGIVDSVGDEWHTLTVADDDSANPSLQTSAQSEWRASDGKVHLFVINPKTPCLTWSVTGTGQFYTTPAKTFFVPHIYDQTTYFATGSSGTVSVTIRDINGNNVFYRINGGSFTDAGASHITIDQDDFNAGENTLEYYYAGNVAHTRIRRVFKNPAYPSVTETHGDRLWLGATNFEVHVKEQLKSNWWMNQWRTQGIRHGQVSIQEHKNTGKRNIVQEVGIVNALVARCYGMTEKRSSTALHSFAEYAKFVLMENITNLDPVGLELQENFVAKGTKELLYRGYYDVLPIFSHAGTYDIIAGYFRADQGHANGLTAVEDHFIRDSLARWVHMCGLQVGGHGGTGVDVSALSDDTPSLEPGMWTTARFTGASMIACMMPGYSTPYYGTSGMAGEKAPAPDSSIFLPHVNHTWFEVFVDDRVAPIGYPHGLQSYAGYDIQFTAEGKWHDRISYSDTPLMGLPLGVHYNMLKMYHPERTIPNMDLAMGLAAKGDLYGIKLHAAGDEAPAFRSWPHMQNAWHPEFRAVAQPAMLALASTNSQSISAQANHKPLLILWYDKEIPLGMRTGAPIPPAGLRRQE